MNLAGYLLEKLREDTDVILYRGREANGPSRVLVLAPAARKTEAASVLRLENEFALASELDPAWAVKPLALTRHDGRAALVLSDPGGKPLDRVLDKPMELTQFLSVAIGLADTLVQVHGCGLIHKDVRPANVFVDEAGNLRLSGFGFATRMPRERQVPAPPEVIAGTLAYMSPEQTGRVNRSIDNRSDLYSLGVTLYEMLVGELPFTVDDPMEWVYCHIARPVPPPSVRVEGVPPPLEAVILKLLAKNAEDRYQTAAGVEYDLRRCRAGLRSRRLIEPFTIGERDLSGRLRIPEKLYGREVEIGVMQSVFDQVATRGKFAFLLVSGYSGVGKSSVVHELHRTLYSTRGLFAAGKFDQYKRNIPYVTLAEAFQGLLRQILSEDDAKLSRWRALLSQAVGSSGQLVVDLIPELALILGEQPAPPSLSAPEEKGRFHLVFRRFISAFAQPEHPLVLFLDDLQWLDAATLDLLEGLNTDEQIPNLLLIGAYRSNEVDSSHGLGRRLEVIRAAGGLTECRLGPLTLNDVSRMVADALHVEAETVGSLAELVFQKTQGNPFFAIQFLTTLHTNGLLKFDWRAGSWQWDLARIRATGITDNVAELVAAELVRYDSAALMIIKQFACMGNYATKATLSRVLGLAEGEVDLVLREFVAVGLLHRFERGYAFAHDRVREAAYALIPDAEREAIHLRIGRLLAEGIGRKDLEENIFEIVNQFNRGPVSTSSPEERQRLAELNLIAGKRAKAATAYESALTYLAAGCAFLAPDSWERQYRTTFELEFHRADCMFVLGDVDFAEARLMALSERSADLSDLALVLKRQVILYTYMGRSDRALMLSIECLARMGIVLPLDPPDEVVEAEYRGLLERIGSRTIESLFDLPMMTDSHWQEVMDLLGALLSPSGVLQPDLHDLCLLRMVNISLDHGHADESCHAYVNLGARVLGWRFNNFSAGHGFGKLALRLIEERGLDRYAARVYTLISGILGPWSLPIEECFTLATRAIEMPREPGGATYSYYAWVCGLTALLGSGKTLSEVQRLADAALSFAKKSKFSLVIEFITTQLMLIRALRGITSEFASFNNVDFREEEYERYLENAPHLSHAAMRYWIRKLQLQFFAGNYATCLEITSKVGGNAGQSPILKQSPVFEVVEYRFYSALAHAAMLTQISGEAAAVSDLELRSSHGHLNSWAERYPDNFADRACLLTAEIARLEGRELDAERYYEQAIRLARHYGFVHNEGLCNELASRFYAARGFEVIAEAYLRNARSCYLRWGADGKVSQLDQLFPHLRDDLSPRRAASVKSETRYQHLDVAAVVAMHQAVSGEIVLDRLIERLMVTVVEHAGAVRGLLLLSRDGELQIVAEAVTHQEAVAVKLKQQAHTPAELPYSVLNYVTRTHDVIIIDDALEENPHSGDPYIVISQPRSVLCLPLVRLKRLVGALYLENNLASHIFTQDRLSVLQLLASQAAISIENAELFKNIQKTQEHARRVGDELLRSFDMIPALAWRASPDGTFELANKQWHDYTGVSRDEARGSTWIRAFHPDDTEKVSEKWRHLSRFRTSGEFEARMRRFDGEFRSFLVRITPMYDERQEIVKWHGTNTDIENLKRAEQAQEAFARVSRVTAMGELTVSIAHEVNQPLMAIVTNAATCLQWLSDPRPNIPEARRAAERIIRDGHRAGDVIASIRALARKSVPQAIELDLHGAILEVLSLTANELERHAITVETDFATDAKFVFCDRVQLQQVMLNLIVNGIEAINAAVHEPRRLRISCQRGDTGYILVSVADNGIGLGASGHERIFDVFFTTKTDGIGMGLSICRSIVEAHRGRLWAERNVPHGTTFQFTVPAFADVRVNELTSGSSDADRLHHRG